MSENKFVDGAVEIINNSGFKAGQMQAVVAKDPYWTLERLQELWPSEAEFVNVWTAPHITTRRSHARKVKTFNKVPVKNLFRMCLQKTHGGFVHKCVRGWGALHINGLLKQKCKKGPRRNYAYGKPKLTLKFKLKETNESPVSRVIYDWMNAVSNNSVAEIGLMPGSD